MPECLFSRVSLTKRAMAVEKLVTACATLAELRVVLALTKSSGEEIIAKAAFHLVIERLQVIVLPLLDPYIRQFYNPQYRGSTLFTSGCLADVRGWRKRYPSLDLAGKGAMNDDQ